MFLNFKSNQIMKNQTKISTATRKSHNVPFNNKNNNNICDNHDQYKEKDCDDSMINSSSPPPSLPPHHHHNSNHLFSNHQYLNHLSSSSQHSTSIPINKIVVSRDELKNANNINKEISIACRNVRYEVKQYSRSIMIGNGGVRDSTAEINSHQKPILRRLNGHFWCRSLNGLLGPSGAGKTTFLNALSGKDRSGLSKDSEIYMNYIVGTSQSGSISSSSSSTICFIGQHVDQSIVPRMSVRDILWYAYRFKNNTKRTWFQKRKKNFNQFSCERHMSQVITELMLDERILDRYFVHCSGGEQKRIAIAQELMSLTAPQFMFIDEPTTGLDSCAAHQVVKCLKTLTKQYQITVMASIHLPSQETLNLFDKLFVLAKGGVAIYSGPPNEIRPFLMKQKVLTTTTSSLQQEQEQPPIETLMRIACNGFNDPKVVQLANHVLVVEYQSVSQQMMMLMPILSASTFKSQSSSSTITEKTTTIYNNDNDHNASSSNVIYRSFCRSKPNTLKSFSISDLVLQIRRFFHIIFLANFSHLTFNICQFVLLFLILSTLYNDEMAMPRSCYLFDQQNSTLTCINDLHETSLVAENNTFHGYTVLLVGFLIMCTSAILFSPIVKVFRNEHRNSKFDLNGWIDGMRETDSR